ncbi:MAG: AAA family ATPase [Candidatus Thiodiazotropha sp. (ex Lucinoma borealis)]|nr:AAA family ATPase [Candidatus Thiodiazotropha sp. (ex Lucinoma borealis)]
MIIRHLQISNFRGIRELSWFPKPGVNCLIGPGDSGKSTILDAIDLAMGARRQFVFSDSDFHLHDTSKNIDIKITVGQLSPELLSIDRYGRFHRGFNPETLILLDEPSPDSEVALTLRLLVSDDLEPVWSLYSDRAHANNEERNLIWAHRQAISPVRLGAYSSYHMAWGSNSVLNKMSQDKARAASALAAAARQARETFADVGCDGVDDVLEKVNEVAQQLGIPAQDPQALLDVRGVSFTGGAIGLHDNRSVPLKNLGTGSSRLLVTGLQNKIGASSVTLIDEVEHGLEPYRIMRLLDELGAKSESSSIQVFMTTHSPVVLRELKANQLSIVKAGVQIIQPQQQGENNQQSIIINTIIPLTGTNEDEQKLLRTNAEAFLAPSIIVCEGKTEIGLMRGLDFNFTERGHRGLISHGCFWADGNGDPSLLNRAKIFANLGYRVTVLMDSDKPTDPNVLNELHRLGVNLHRWQPGHSTESAIFNSVPATSIQSLLAIACEWKSVDAVNEQIRNASGGAYNLENCRNNFLDPMRTVLAQSAGKGSWYKDMEPAERVMREVIAPNWQNCQVLLTGPLQELIQWIQQAPTAQPERQS